MKKLLICILITFTANVNSQIKLPTVQLPISNNLQETTVWCWAAVAQQIIRASKGIHQTPPQCALVAVANNALPSVCCAGAGNPACVKTGSMQQIQQLIWHFGGKATSLFPPANYMTLYNTLASGRAIILQVQSGAMAAHVVVLTGMSFSYDKHGNVQPFLHINDPVSFYNQRVPFQNIVPVWMSALVVQ